jgi:hypothetical protein
MTLTKKIITRILKNKTPRTATHFFIEGGYITFLKNKTMFKPKKLTKKEYLEFINSPLQPFKNWSL